MVMGKVIESCCCAHWNGRRCRIRWYCVGT
jgi:hypothetical protein